MLCYCLIVCLPGYFPGAFHGLTGYRGQESGGWGGDKSFIGVYQNQMQTAQLMPNVTLKNAHLEDINAQVHTLT